MYSIENNVTCKVITIQSQANSHINNNQFAVNYFFHGLKKN